ncbi:MAG: hypothetical protein FGM33_05665 [Candidatus Kapabacteria bacterium]|nr:hypothetical protein [Candidatus Kapabacteria bacterium]
MRRQQHRMPLCSFRCSISSTQMAFTYLPFFHGAFRTAPLPLTSWTMILTLGVVTCPIVAFEKT